MNIMGGEENINHTCKVTTQCGDTHNKREESNDEVTTERGDEVSVPESNDKKKIMKLKPPTIKDNPKLKRKNNRRKKI